MRIAPTGTSATTGRSIPAGASRSAGIELLGHEIVVLGLSQDWSGPLTIDHAVMNDAIDVEPCAAPCNAFGFAANGQLSSTERNNLVALLAESEPSAERDPARLSPHHAR